MRTKIVVVMALLFMGIGTSSFAQFDHVGDWDVNGRVNSTNDMQITTNDLAFRIKTNSGALRTVLRLDSLNNARFGSPNVEMGDLKLQVGGQGNALIVRSGTGNVEMIAMATCAILEITGGSDLSEQFNVSDAGDVKVEPGMVVSIDIEKPGELVVSSKAYDRTVAGIVSGAGGLKTGMRMGQKASIAYGDHPVALTGRVYCFVDASLWAVQPGDLLTTSPTKGHAMKVFDHVQAMGAILGKAMTPLAEGEKGLVLVLVSLQ